MSVSNIRYFEFVTIIVVRFDLLNLKSMDTKSSSKFPFKRAEIVSPKKPELTTEKHFIFQDKP